MTRGVPEAGLRAPPAGAASHPAQMTSHENALGWMGYRTISSNKELSQAPPASGSVLRHYPRSGGVLIWIGVGFYRQSLAWWFVQV